MKSDEKEAVMDDFISDVPVKNIVGSPQLAADGASFSMMNKDQDSLYANFSQIIEEVLELSRYLRWTFVSCDTGFRKPDERVFHQVSVTLGILAQWKPVLHRSPELGIESTFSSTMRVPLNIVPLIKVIESTK